jgi:hypothetical protein
VLLADMFGILAMIDELILVIRAELLAWWFW